MFLPDFIPKFLARKISSLRDNDSQSVIYTKVSYASIPIVVCQLISVYMYYTGRMNFVWKFNYSSGYVVYWSMCKMNNTVIGIQNSFSYNEQNILRELIFLLLYEQFFYKKNWHKIIIFTNVSKMLSKLQFCDIMFQWHKFSLNRRVFNHF